MGEPVDHVAALRSARQRFLSTFPDRLAAITGLVDSLAGEGGTARAESLRQAVHQMGGLSGLIGFPLVGERAKHLEALLLDPASSADVSAIAAGVQALREAMDTDRQAPEPEWWGPAPTSTSKGRVLIVEDDAEQRAVIASALRGGGYEVVEAERGDLAVGAARTHRPAVILLDIDLPGLDGLSVCRQLRTDPDLRTTAIVFATVRGSAIDRGAGLALGADDYVVKPLDAGDLLLRLDLAIRRRASARPADEGVAEYPAFAASAAAALAESPAALALVRAPRDRLDLALDALGMNLRRRDLLGRFDGMHLIVLMPRFSAAMAADRLGQILGGNAGADGEFQLGVAASSDAAEHTLDALIALADASLETRAPAAAAAPKLVLVAEDEPDIARVIDSQLRAAGYRTQVVFDGRRAVDAIRAGGTDAAVLDLMMPGLSGFDVLAGIRQTPSRPRVIVVSGRGREVDVTRAFDLGADDYIMKPFSPQELLARLARLLR